MNYENLVNELVEILYYKKENSFKDMKSVLEKLHLKRDLRDELDLRETSGEHNAYVDVLQWLDSKGVKVGRER